MYIFFHLNCLTYLLFAQVTFILVNYYVLLYQQLFWTKGTVMMIYRNLDETLL